ncbi:FKBP-type peptidyl-prolyl cis-trans isomerase [Aestuariirhabdus litorea]|uniref:Peptidyl-prolyl cis-trans isomerase n=1 Tax=Aestuariirhabdus litorea TaxID=2528527 RepID=A0A3P3VK01_9GAMM|nr:FKBP-type peptidyl-prolyl cis-trans isomerase [Aestuariirhabdus litorea]RRJ83052.1 FKBP-type peptidyl-prolyl cis-trans isomerase [Aestuariirhabdus litorea]RWW93210.1 FKBP-type peptidyl-prolyl cis-trans isomerase [Endozoicomonadaceae bacterium GTF-13]
MVNILLGIAIVAAAFFLIQSVTSKNQKAAAENVRAGEAFLVDNAKQEGVQTTASGLQFKVLQAGTGSEHPGATDRVRVHYHGTLIDGSVFDSSVERGEPISFGLNQVIPGWTEGVQLMVVGEKTRFFIPSALGYGNRSAGSIPPGSVLVFDVELLGINE